MRITTGSNEFIRIHRDERKNFEWNFFELNLACIHSDDTIIPPAKPVHKYQSWGAVMRQPIQFIQLRRAALLLGISGDSLSLYII